MQAVFDALAQFDSFLISAVESGWMLSVLLLVCVVDGFFPPVPSELVLLTAAGVAWSTNPQLLVLVIVTAALGAWAGDNIAYAMGRRLGMRPLPWMKRGRAAVVLDKIGDEFGRRPESIILTGRFVPVARIAVNMAAGATRLPYRRFVVLSLLSATIWAVLSALIAVVVGALVTRHPTLGTLIAVGVALAGGVLLDRVLAWKRHNATERADA